MQSCAIALGKYDIRANAVLPGTIATDINKEDLSDSDKREYMIKRTALGRLGGSCYVRIVMINKLICIKLPTTLPVLSFS